MTDIVECHAGYRYAQRPIAFYWQGERRVIEAIVDLWLTPEGRGFRVVTQDEQVFELYFLYAQDDWKVKQP